VAAVSAQFGGGMMQGGLGGMGMGGGMLPQYMLLRMMYGDNIASMMMSNMMANMMGGGPMSRYLSGEVFDAPDRWWITSSIMNRNRQNQANLNPASMTGAINVPGAALPGGTI